MNIETLVDQSLTEQGLTDQDPTDQGLVEPNMDEYLTDRYDYQVPRRGDIRTGVVIETNEQGLVVDVGLKREGFVPAEDLSRLDEETRSGIQIGTTISVLVIQPEDREGHPVLSIHQARLYEDWLKAEQMMESGELYEGEVSGYNRGGLVVQFGRIRGFVPASQIMGLPRRLREEERRKRLAAMIGQQMGLKIIEVDRHRRRLIFSQRRALRAWQELQRERVVAQLTEGETRFGRVTSITNFGAFVDLGGADGLIHVSELSWSRIDNPRQMLKVGDEVEVYVLDVDRQRKRIALSLKKLQPDPWTLADDHYRVGQLVEGRVTRVVDFGAFVELGIGIEGLLHASEMIGTPEFRPSDIVHLGETLLVKIIRIDSRRKRVALSARQVRQDEWERWVAEQQAARETPEEAVGEAAEEEATAPEAEMAVGEAAEVPEAVASETAEEEATTPEAEAAAGEAAEEEAEAEEAAAIPGAVASEIAGEEAAAPEAEAAAGEAAEEEAEVEEAAAILEAVASETAEEEAATPEAEAAESGVAEEEAEAEEAAAIPGAVASETAEEEAATPEAEAAAGEAAEEEAEVEEAAAIPGAVAGETAEEEAAAPEAETAEASSEEPVPVTAVAAE